MNSTSFTSAKGRDYTRFGKECLILGCAAFLKGYVMANTLLDRFLEYEATDFVINRLGEALREPLPQIRHFNFNIFDITIDHELGTVVIEDDLDVTEAGTLVVSIAEFITALDRKAESSRT
jgi:hypothetical protein